MKPFRTRLLSLILHVAAAISLLSMAALAGDAAGIGAQALEPIPAIVPGALATQEEDSVTASGRQEAEDPGAHLQHEPAITHDDTIAHENMADLSNQATSQISWETIPNLVYSGTEQNTIRLSNVPYRSEVTVTYKKNSGSTSHTWFGTSPSASTEFDILPLTEAGRYCVENITVTSRENNIWQSSNIYVSIAPKPVSVPSAGPHTYSQQSVTAFTVPEDSLYTMTEASKQYNTQTNAGTYQVSFELEDKTNYIWANQADDNRDGIVTVEWTILPKAVPVPSAWSHTPAYSYTGSAIQQVTYIPTMQGASAGYGTDGSLVLTWNNEIVWTVTNACQTNAGQYTSVAELNSANFCWETDFSQTDKTLGSWTITPQSIQAPSVTAPDAAYDGASYDAQITVGGHTEILTQSTDEPYLYYESDGKNQLSGPPTNAGTYQVQVNWVYDTQNYHLSDNPKASFTISRAAAALSFQESSQTAYYTAAGTALQLATVSDLVGADSEKTPSYLYAITYTYRYSAVPDPYWEGISPQEITDPATHLFSQAGYYQITARLGAGTQTHNYTADPATYTLTISPVAPTLTFADAENGTISLSYDGAAVTEGNHTAQVSGITGGREPAGTISYTYYASQTEAQSKQGAIPAPSAAGTYWVRADYTPGENDCYTAVHAIVNLEISNAAMTVQAQNYQDAYDGQVHALSSLISVSGVGDNLLASEDYQVAFCKASGDETPLPDAQAPCWTENPATQVRTVAHSGTYFYKVTAANYDTVIGSVTVSIDRAELTLGHGTVQTQKIYDGTTTAAVETAGSIQGIQSGDSIQFTVSANYNSKDVLTANSITVSYSLQAAEGVLENYRWGSTNFTSAVEQSFQIDTISGSITRRPLSAALAEQTHLYDGSTTISLSGPVTVTGLASGEGMKAELCGNATGTAASKNVAHTDNTVSVDASQIRLSGSVEGGLTAADPDNYTLSVTAPRVTITPKPIQLSFQAQDGLITTIYSAEPVSESLYAATISGVVSGDSLPGESDIVYTFYTDAGCTAVLSDAPVSAGEYWVKATVNSSSGVNSNYSSAESVVKLVINPNEQVALTVLPQAYSDTYDGLAHPASGDMEVKAGNETLPQTDYTIYYSTTQPNEGQALDPAAYQTEMPSFTNAGSRTVYYLVDTKNYRDVAGIFTVSIDRAELTLQRDISVTKPYDGTASANGQVSNIQLTGQQNNESITVALAGAVYDSATVSAEKITVTYTLTAEGGASLDNYQVRIHNAAAQNAAQTMTESMDAAITAAPITVTIQDQTAVYDGEKPEVQQSSWTVTAGEIYQPDGTPDDLGIILRIPDNAMDAGTYPIGGAASNPNYQATFVAGTFAVTTRPVTVTIGNACGLYGEAPDLSRIALTAQNMAVTDSSELFRNLLSTSACQTSDVGHYPITGTNGVTGNYLVTFTSGTYTVNKRPITISIADKDSLYGQDIQDLTWQISHGSMAHGEDLEIVLETTASKNSQTGTYPISVNSYDDNVAANYDITVQKGTYTIGKAGLSLSFGQETLSVPADGTAHNPLHVANSSSGATLSNLPADVTVSYTSSDPQVAAVDQASGAVTMVNTGNTTITATVTDGGQNFTGGSSASYTLHVTLAEQDLQVSVQPKALTYTGLPQALVTAQVTFPTDRQVNVEYSLDQETYGTAIPTATDAGTYTVYWRASANGYADANGSLTVTVKQKPLTAHMIGGVDSSYAYTGQQITVPALTVTDGGTPLVYGRDYTVTYGTNLNPGIDSGSVRITGMGNYTGQVEKTFSIHIDPGQPDSDLELTVTPDHWTYTASPSVSISVGFNGTAIEDYRLTVSNAAGPLVTDGTVTEALSALVEPGTYTVTANGTGAYANASDTVTVTVARITPTVRVTAAPASLSGSGKITLTLSGSDLPAGTDLTTLLTVSTANGAAPDLSQLTWSQRNGIYTAALPLSNANETYTFILAYPGDAYHSPALDRASVSTTWSGGSSGGGAAVSPVPEDPDNEENTGIADPDDTGVSDWLITENHVQYLGGYGGGLFGPADHMTRAQVAQMFYHLLENQNVPVTACFTDVPESAWYAPAINTLASLGILNGTTDTLFAPDRPITRAEFVVIAMRFAQADAGAEDTFSDVQQQDWFYEQVLNAVAFGWINGYSDGTFRPGQTITRAQVAVITNRILGRSADKAYLDAHADQLVQFDDVSTSYWAYYDILEAANTYGPVS